MNTQTQEALKMAIEALEWANEVSHSLDRYDWVIQACKEALASNSEALEQPAQEPVYAIVVDRHIQYDMNTGLLEIYNSKEQAERSNFLGAEIKAIDVSAHPAPSWVSLSDDDMAKLCDKYWDSENGHSIKDIISMVEQALKEKNHE